MRAQSHDREALEALLRSVQPALRRYLTSLAGAADADDLLQDVLVIVIRRLGTLDDPALFRPWAYRIASREAFRHIRKRRSWLARRDDETLIEELPLPAAPPAGELLHELLHDDSVPPASRAVLLLHFAEELTLPEVAAILEIPLGTAKSRLAYGLRSIRKRLSGTGD